MNLPCKFCSHQMVCKYQDEFKKEYDKYSNKTELVILDIKCKHYSSFYQINSWQPITIYNNDPYLCDAMYINKQI